MSVQDVIDGKRLWHCQLGDVRESLRAMPSGIARTCVTSPPYYGLRDYGTATWDGGDAECTHKPATMRKGRNEDRPMLAGSLATNAAQLLLASRSKQCQRCGATKIDFQIGLEDNPGEFVAALVDVFREVRRVLTDDGTAWINIGDSYANDGKFGGETGGKQAYHDDNNRKRIGREQRKTGLPPKSLIGVPWKLAFALQADGWILRQDIIWHKPNPMPESVQDRCTKSHEYLFLLSKSPRYYFDSQAISEPTTCDRLRGSGPMVNAGTGRGDAGSGTVGDYRAKKKHRSPAGWKTGSGSHGSFHEDGREQEVIYNEVETDSRNKRSVWTIPTYSYSGAHFATFPPKLVEPCILAGSKAGDIVLEPFAGSGTTLAVAVGNGRRAIGCELNPDYVKLTTKRMRCVTPPLTLAAS